MAKQARIDPLTVAYVMKIADCCDKTAEKALRGERIRGRVGLRVQAAITELEDVYLRGRAVH